MAVYLLDKPLPANDEGHEYETCMLDILPRARFVAAQEKSLLAALKFSFPVLVHLKDLLPNASTSVVFRNTLLPIHLVVSDRMSGGRNPSAELLVQFTKDAYENSAWVKEKFVPQQYLDEFYSRVNAEEDADPPDD